MKVKVKKVYYCDYCKKSGGSAGHMKRHERGCTKNPNRECGVCGLVEGTPQPLESLIRLWQDAEEERYHAAPGKGYDFLTELLTNEANAVLPQVRDAANNCPACILASIRQAGIPVPMVTGFDWTNEMKAVWDEFNAAKSGH